MQGDPPGTKAKSLPSQSLGIQLTEGKYIKDKGVLYSKRLWRKNTMREIKRKIAFLNGVVNKKDMKCFH